jgi:hypothetical protein
VIGGLAAPRRARPLVHRLVSVATAAGLAASAGACAGRLLVRPSGPGVPAPNGAAHWNAVVDACRNVRTYRARLGLSGTVANRRIPGFASAVLGLAVTAAGEIGLEARVSGQPVFTMAGTSDHARLLLVDDQRIVDAPADAIVDALIGVPIGPARLLAILAGCVSTSDAMDEAVRYGDLLRVVSGDATVFLEERDGVWRAQAGDAPGLRVDYQAMESGRPRRIALRSVSGAEPSVSIVLRVDEAEINRPLPPSVFTVRVPDTATPMSIDELRASGPAR